jgi:hypothetical protein
VERGVAGDLGAAQLGIDFQGRCEQFSCVGRAVKWSTVIQAARAHSFCSGHDAPSSDALATAKWATERLLAMQKARWGGVRDFGGGDLSQRLDPVACRAWTKTAR